MHLSAPASIVAIANHAKYNRQSPALIDPDGINLNYEELWTQILAVGSRLQEAGVGSQEIAAVLLPQSALEAAVVAGVLNYCVCAPLKSRTTTEEVEAVLGKLGASALIVSQEFEAEAEAAIKLGICVLAAQNMRWPGDWQIRRPAFRSTVRAVDSDAVLMLLTSSTTGNSKIVPLTAANLDAQTAPRSKLLQLSASDRLLQMTPHGHSMGIENTLAQFLAGGAVIATGGFEPIAYLRWLRELGPTWYDCSPAVHQAALAQLKRTPLDLPIPLRLVQSAGAPLASEVKQELEQILRVPHLNDYGMTETGPIATDAVAPYDRIPNSAGRTCGLELRIMDKSGELLATGEEGEIVVRGDAVFHGYFDDPDANRRAFQDGWFRTGDLGHLDRDGNLFVTGRLKEMINRGGEKVLPSEVEAALSSHPKVLEATAFAVPHPTLGEDVACAVVLREGSESQVSSRELQSYAAQHLASFKVPHRIFFVNEIPRGELGKPQRWLLAERLSGRNAAPPTPAEFTELSLFHAIVVSLHEIWSRILARDDLGFNEDFFAAGGDSLAAINMLAEVDQRFGSQTSDAAASFIDEPTLAHLASLVGKPSQPRPDQSGSSNMQIFPVGEGSSATRLFCFPSEGNEGLYFRRLAAHLRGEMNLSIVRPANTWYARSLFTFERAAAEAMARIREVQPQGPYFLSGHCFGGLAAVEAAQQLLREGQEVRVILFETIMPTFPGFLRNWRLWADGIRRQWHRIWTVEHPGVRHNIQRFSSRLLWSALVPFRRFLRPFEQASVVQWIVEWSEFDNYPPYKIRPIDAPFLSILSADEPRSLSAFNAVSRFRWRSIARGGFEERFVPYDHYNVLHESNLPEIAGILISWCGAHGTIDVARGGELAHEDPEPRIIGA